LLAGAVLLILPCIAATRTAAAALCLPALLWRPEAPAFGHAKLTVLDVGQGLAAVVKTQSHVLVYDAGPAFRSGRDTGELVVVPYLYSQGQHAIDALMISHGDLDHQGGMQSILETMPVGRLIVGPSVKLTRSHVAEICQRGTRWSWDGVKFEILHPSGTAYAKDNDSSCVLRVEANGMSALLAGDIQEEAETALIDQQLDRASVVVVPHHGSRTSSTPRFVAATRPQFAIFSAGYRNRWGFPKADVVERWNGEGARALSTIEGGAISIELNGAAPSAAHEFRLEHRHYWRAR
jgi:competence protein ComEC